MMFSWRMTASSQLECPAQPQVIVDDLPPLLRYRLSLQALALKVARSRASQ